MKVQIHSHWEEPLEFTDSDFLEILIDLTKGGNHVEMWMNDEVMVIHILPTVEEIQSQTKKMAEKILESNKRINDTLLRMFTKTFEDYG